MQLKPLFDNVDIREYKGKFHVQLEIPESSTLTPRDIDTIGYSASWYVNPNNIAGGYEGLRSILIKREHAIIKKGIELGALQISGIGSKKPDFVEGGLSREPEGLFQEPSSENVIEMAPGTLMATSYAENGKLSGSRPDYRAFGTYTASELKAKIINTNLASGFNLEKMIAPHVEVYGRYLDDRLQNREGNFGFVVFPVPSVTQQRMAADIVERFPELLPRTNIRVEQAIMAFYTLAALNFTSVVSASRELHDKVRYAHLQLHLSNAYSCNGIPYIMDWATLTPLADNRENNIINRTIDLLKPQEGFQKLLKNFFGQFFGQDMMDVFSVKLHGLSMEIYSGNSIEVNAIEESLNASSILGRSANDFETVAEWMKRQGVEGFPKYEKRSGAVSKAFLSANNQRVGRNEPCPCGSGKKYKKCCGGH